MVELIPVEVESAYKRAHRAVLRVYRNERSLGVRQLDDLPILFLVFLDAYDGARTYPPRERGPRIEHALGKLEALPRDSDRLSAAPVYGHALRSRLENERREQVIAVGMVLQCLLVVFLACVLDIDEPLRAAVSVPLVVFEQALAKRSVGGHLFGPGHGRIRAKP